MSATYSLEVRLDGRTCVVVGGGAVAARKAKALAAAGAGVHVVAPEIDPAIRELPGVKCLAAPYDVSVLGGAALVFACTDDAEVNARVARDARAVGAWANVADDPVDCDFFGPAVLERGDLRVAVSTGGASPHLAAALRDRLGEIFGPEYALLVEEMRRARAEVLRRVTDPAVRRRIFETLCAECSATLLATRGVAAWREWLERTIRRRLADSE
jgi:precorrin-2 dehydrogenase/sirohydrochlorin ferrochelatase